MATAGAAVRGLTKDIDTTNDRTAWLAQSILGLGPALVPLGAAATPILTGVATQMTLAGTAAITTALAFVGVGDALKSLNDYQLKPSAANLNKMLESLDKLGPAGESFVRFLDSVGPEFKELQMSAREGIFPGVEEGIEHFMGLLPRLNRIIGEVAEGMGELTTDAGRGLAGPAFRDFFVYLDREAKPLLIEMGHTFGNFAEGLANMLVNFAPLTRGFSAGFLEMSERFAAWSHQLDTDQSFQGFLAYVQEVGPMALDFFGSFVDALTQILEAAAPVGHVLLPALTGVLDVVAALADTPLGPVFIAGAAAMSLYGRAAALASITTGGLTGKLIQNSAAMRVWSARANSMALMSAPLGRAFSNVAGGAALLTLTMTDLDNEMGLSNTAMGAAAGLMVGGAWGAAIGASIGGVKDLADAHAHLGDEIARANAALASGSRVELRRSLAEMQEAVRSFDIDSITDFSGIGNFFGGVITGELGQAGTAAEALEDRLWDLRAAAGDGSVAMNTIFAPSLGVGTDALEVMSASVDELHDRLGRLNRRLSGRASWRDYEEAIDAVTAALKKNGKTLDITTPKGRANQEALDKIAATSIEVAASLRGMDRVNFMNRARRDFIDAAEKLGKTHDAAVALATDLGLLHYTTVKPKVDDTDIRNAVKTGDDLLNKLLNIGVKHPKPKVDKKPIDAAKASADTLLGSLGLIDGYHARATISIKRIGDALFGDGTLFPKPKKDAADGDTVPKTGLPYADRHHYLLADGEEVVSNRYGQADRNRDLLKAISANRLADGGTVGMDWLEYDRRNRMSAGAGRPAQAAAGIDIAALVAAVARNTRPMFGDIHESAHDYTEFKRERQRDMALGGMDGIQR